MITEEKKNKMAIECGLTERRKTMCYRESIKKDLSPDDEIAILRKGLVCALNTIAMLHPEIITETAFVETIEYFNLIEAKKNMVKSELGLLPPGEVRS